MDKQPTSADRWYRYVIGPMSPDTRWVLDTRDVILLKTSAECGRLIQITLLLLL